MSNHFDRTAGKAQSRWVRVGVSEEGNVKTFVYKERSENDSSFLSGFLRWAKPSSTSEIKEESK
jgi:hypothetical protein